MIHPLLSVLLSPFFKNSELLKSLEIKDLSSVLDAHCTQNRLHTKQIVHTTDCSQNRLYTKQIAHNMIWLGGEFSYSPVSALRSKVVPSLCVHTSLFILIHRHILKRNAYNRIHKLLQCMHMFNDNLLIDGSHCCQIGIIFINAHLVRTYCRSIHIRHSY